MSRLSDYVVFHNPKLAKRYSDRPIPMSFLYEAYFDGEIDIVGDIYALLKNRNAFVQYSLTRQHYQWAITKFVPEAVVHSKDFDKKLVCNHYDRGNDFFGWFLGERMVYTSAFFERADNTLEEAQDNKMRRVCEKLQLQPGERLLDIGCGWGTLTAFAAERYGVDATGVTLSSNQTEFGMNRIQEKGLSSRARILCKDYRDIPPGKYDKISCLEMVEHVGVKNLNAFYEQVNDLLADQGVFVLQWTGLRGLRQEDLIWGLFMAKYIFPGADASLSPAAMLRYIEKGGFESASIENVTHHYGVTIKKWHDNWVRNREAVTQKYGDRWFRIWNFFLAWSTMIAAQGNAACHQLVLHKNTNSYDRTRWFPYSNTRNANTVSRPRAVPEPQPLVM